MFFQDCAEMVSPAYGSSSLSDRAAAGATDNECRVN